MSKYEQRRQQRLQNPQVAFGYKLMDAELQLLHALEAISQQRHMNEDIARLLSQYNADMTLGSLIELLSALDMTATLATMTAHKSERTRYLLNICGYTTRV